MKDIASQLDLLTKDWVSSTVRVGETTSGRYGYTSAPAAPLIARAVQYVLILASLNAQMCCSVPIRLMKPANSKGKPKRKSWREKAAHKWQRNPRGVGVKAASYAAYADEIEEVTEHPALDLLRRPNPFMDGTEWEEVSQLCLEVCGNCYDYFDGDGSGPKEVYPLYPSFVRIVPSETEYITAYVYARDATDPFVIDAEAVGHQKFRPSMTGDYYGTGPLHACTGETDMLAAATISELARWQNGSRPDYAIESTTPITSKEQLEQIRAEVRRFHRGVKKAGEPMILGQAKLNTLGFKPKDMEYQAGMEWCCKIFRNAYGVPESMTDLNDANLASSKTGNRQYMAQTVAPRRAKRAEYLTERLLPMFGVAPGEMWFCPDNASGEDEAAETERQVMMVDCGGMTLNELRAEEGLDPYPAEIGDVPRYKGTEMVSAAAKAEQDAANAEANRAHDLALATATAKQPMPPDTTAKDLAATIMDGAKALVETTMEGANGIGNRKHNPDEVQGATEGKSEVSDGVSPDNHDTKTMLGLFGVRSEPDHCKAAETPDPNIPPEALAQQAALAKKLKPWYADALSLSLIEADGSVVAETRAELAEKLTAIARTNLMPIYGTGMAQGAVNLAQVPGAAANLAMNGVTPVLQAVGAPASTASAFGFSFNVPQTYAINFQETYLPKFVDGVTTEIRQAVQDAIRAGLDNGEALAGIQARIKEAIPDVADWKAKQIAQTEANHARSQGQLVSMKLAGETWKAWRLSGNPCPVCIAIAARGGIPIEEKFYDADHFDGMTPPAHPGCACSLANANGPGLGGVA